MNKKEGLVKDIPASDKDGNPSLPMVSYTVKVTTGNCRGAGTDANVFIVLTGSQGDSGKLDMEGPGNLFERGKTDTFQYNLVDLGDLKKIRIGHDGKGIGAGWFCANVNVECSSGKKWDFPCNKYVKNFSCFLTFFKMV